MRAEHQRKRRTGRPGNEIARPLIVDNTVPMHALAGARRLRRTVRARYSARHVLPPVARPRCIRRGRRSRDDPRSEPAGRRGPGTWAAGDKASTGWRVPTNRRTTSAWSTAPSASTSASMPSVPAGRSRPPITTLGQPAATPPRPDRTRGDIQCAALADAARAVNEHDIGRRPFDEQRFELRNLGRAPTNRPASRSWICCPMVAAATPPAWRVRERRGSMRLRPTWKRD